MKKIGQRVRIRDGMPEFIGKTGSIINYAHDGNTRLYRVRLDEPVEIAGTEVSDDLWAGSMLSSLQGWG